MRTHLFSYQKLAKSIAGYVHKHLFSAKELSKIVAGSRRVTSCVGQQLFGKSNSFFLNLLRGFLRSSSVQNRQSLTRKVFTTPKAYGKPEVDVRATTNRSPLLSSCFGLMSTLLNNKANQLNH